MMLHSEKPEGPTEPPHVSTETGTLQEAAFRCDDCEWAWVAFGLAVHRTRCIFCGSESTTVIRRTP